MSKYTVSFPEWSEEGTLEASTLKGIIRLLLIKCGGKLEVKE